MTDQHEPSRRSTREDYSRRGPKTWLDNTWEGPGEIVALAGPHNWQPTTAAVALTRPSAWLDVGTVLRFWHHAIEQTATEISSVAGWLYYGIIGVGFGIGRPAALVQDAAQAMLIKSMKTVGVDPTNFSLLLTAATQACDEVDAPGLLEAVATGMADRLSTGNPPDAVTQAITTLTSSMHPDHRRRVVQVLLRATE